MRQQRLKSDVRRAEKEIQFYMDKAEMSQKIAKIEERRAAKEKDSAEGSDESDDKNKEKRMKNVKKIINYH
jgi:hypothetical protein